MAPHAGQQVPAGSSCPLGRRRGKQHVSIPWSPRHYSSTSNVPTLLLTAARVRCNVCFLTPAPFRKAEPLGLLSPRGGFPSPPRLVSRAFSVFFTYIYDLFVDVLFSVIRTPHCHSFQWGERRRDKMSRPACMACRGASLPRYRCVLQEKKRFPPDSSGVIRNSDALVQVSGQGISVCIRYSNTLLYSISRYSYVNHWHKKTKYLDGFRILGQSMRTCL